MRRYLPTPPFSLFLATLALLALVMFLATRTAYGADLSGTITPPTQNTDGSTIGTTDALSQLRVEYSLCSGSSAFGTKLGEVVLAPTATTWTILGIGYGNYCVRAYAKNILGVESAATATVAKNNPIPTPKPPVLGVISVIAYEIKWHPVDGVLLGRSVGTVPLGTECVQGDAIVGTDYFEVPREAVTFTKEPKSVVIVARCAVSS